MNNKQSEPQGEQDINADTPSNKHKSENSEQETEENLAKKKEAKRGSGLKRPRKRTLNSVYKKEAKKPGLRFGRWNTAEHKRFLEAMEKYGNSWKQVCEYIQTRTADQIRSHAQKYYEGIKSKLIREIKEDPNKKNAVFVVTSCLLYTSPSPRDS